MSKSKNVKEELFSAEPLVEDPIAKVEEKEIAKATTPTRSAEAIALRKANKDVFASQDRREKQERTADCLAYRKLNPKAFPNG